MNPLQIMKFKDKIGEFRERHQGFSRFINAVRKRGLPQGSTIEIKVTFPDEQVMNTSFRIKEDDLELLQMIGNLHKK